MASRGVTPIAIPVTIWCLCFLTVTARHIQPAGSTQTVTCQQHETAVLPFHFPFIPESDIVHVSWMKMETGAEPLVICTLQEGSVEYRTDQYRDRAEVHVDASRGKLELILKDVDTSDEGLYKCQAASKKDHGEKVIQLYVELSVKPTEIMAAEGESVTFQADFSGPRTDVVWKIGEDKLVEVDDHGPPYYYRLADRASASFHSGSLTIRELVESDSGHYSGNILTEGKYHETKFILKVSPSKPKVHYNVTNGAVTLYCQSISKGVTYEWRNSSGDVLSTKAICNVSTNTLRINDTMICIVRNKVCKTNSSLTIVNLHTEKISNVSEILKHILVASLVIVSLLVILTIFFLWYFNKNESEQKKVKLYKVIPVFCGALAVIAGSSIYIGTGDGLERAVKIAVSSFLITLIVTLCLCMFAIHLRLPYCKRTTDNSSQETTPLPLSRMPS